MARVIRSLIGIAGVALALSAQADPSVRAPLSYADCSAIVESLTAMRYDREDGPISEYLNAVAADLERAITTPDRPEWPTCPTGFRAGDANGSVACFANESSFGRYPNVHFDPPSAPEISNKSDGEIEACSRAHYLIYSYAFGDQERVLCARGRRVNGELVFDRAVISIPSRQEYLASKVSDACGQAPAATKSCD